MSKINEYIFVQFYSIEICFHARPVDQTLILVNLNVDMCAWRLALTFVLMASEKQLLDSLLQEDTMVKIQIATCL